MAPSLQLANTSHSITLDTNVVSEPMRPYGNASIQSWLDQQTALAYAPLIRRARTGEYNGTDVRAERGGHMPGAVNSDWQLGMDRNRGLRLRSAEELLPKLASLGITPEK